MPLPTISRAACKHYSAELRAEIANLKTEIVKLRTAVEQKQSDQIQGLIANCCERYTALTGRIEELFAGYREQLDVRSLEEDWGDVKDYWLEVNNSHEKTKDTEKLSQDLTTLRDCLNTLEFTVDFFVTVSIPSLIEELKPEEPLPEEPKIQKKRSAPVKLEVDTTPPLKFPPRYLFVITGWRLNKNGSATAYIDFPPPTPPEPALASLQPAPLVRSYAGFYQQPQPSPINIHHGPLNLAAALPEESAQMQWALLAAAKPVL